MDVKNTIQHYIKANSGSEERTINNTMSKCKCPRKQVESNIDWLIKEGFVIVVPLKEMDQAEQSYYNSDSCRILRNVDYFDEMKFYEKQNQESERVSKLSNIEKFKYFFSKMEKEFDRKYWSNGKTYSLKYGDNDVAIYLKEEQRTISIDFDKTSDWTFMDSDNYILYKIDGAYYSIELDNTHHKCHLRHHKSY